MKLFCFTFAGGTAAFFEPLDDYLPHEISVVKLEYAGHGERHQEAFYRNFEELSEDLSRLLLHHIAPEEPYAMFGYSMGSIACVEVLKKLLAQGGSLPKCVFLAAHAPCCKEELGGYSSQELDEYVKKRTLAFGGVPDELAGNALFWRIYLPVFKADYALIANYQFSPPRPPFAVPAVVFYSEQDTPLVEMQRWNTWFAMPPKFNRFDGTHFFYRNHVPEIATVINVAMR